MATEIPVYLDPKIAVFFYNKMQGDELILHDRGEKVKVVEIDLSSSLGKYIRSQCIKVDKPTRPDKYQFVFKIQDLNSPKYQCSVYQYQNGKRHFLNWPPEFIRDLNELLRDMMHTSLFYYLQGVESCGGVIAKGIRDFMEMHNLWEITTPSTVERMYMRDKNKSTNEGLDLKYQKTTPYSRFTRVNRSERKDTKPKSHNTINIFNS